MLCLPSTVQPLERNLTSCGLLRPFLRNRSHRFVRVLNLQVGKNFVPHSLSSTLQRSSYGNDPFTRMFFTQNSIFRSYGDFAKLPGLFLSLSCLIGLPMSQFHVCNTYITGNPTLPQHGAIFSQAGLAGQRNRSSRLGYGEGACESPRWDVDNESGITMGIITHFP
jgi:hypothetical protein